MTEGKRHVLSIDVETFSSVDLAAAGVYHYVESDDFELMLVGYAFGDQDVHVIDLTQDGYPGATETDREFWKALTDPTVEKHAYNASFERQALERYTGKEMPPEEWVCTMVRALTLGLPGSLAAVGEALGLPKDEQKDKQGKALIQYFCKPCKPTRRNGERTRNLPKHDPDKWALFKEYNRQDVVAERAIAKRLDEIEELYEPEWRLWCLDQHMNDRGIRVDVDMVKKIVEYDERRGAELMEEAQELTGLSNPNSVSQLAGWLTAQGVPMSSVTKDTVSAALKQDIPENVRRVLEIRQALGKASVKKYAAMLNAVCEDGRLRGILQFYGANRTGRWAGRLVQVHNLARNSLPDLELARELAAEGDFDTMQTLFGETAFVFSELVRTAFIASEGCRFVVSDFSAIEARVVAWLAGEQWVLDAFVAGKDIYCETASMMYKVPVVKHGENGHLRAKGKVACLGCGYGGGVGALKAMDSSGAVPEEEMQAVVDAWRKSNPRIVKLWRSYELAAKTAITERRTVKQPHGIEFSYHDSCLFVKLPNGRKICYWGARVREDPATGRESLVYMGVNQETKKWGETETWGGKLVENCIAEDTPVLTDSGWKPIQDVTTDDMLWDGLEWVHHEGLIDKGKQEVISVDGVLMTPDHLVLTEKGGWKHAKDTDRFGGPALRVSDSDLLCRIGRTTEPVEDPVRLREGIYNAGVGVEETEAEVMRVHDEEDPQRKEKDTRDVRDTDLGGLAFHEGKMRVPDGASLEELRRTRDQGLREMVEELRGIPGGYGSDLSEGPDAGQDRRQRRLHSGELPVDHDERTVEEQTQQQTHRDTLGTDHSIGSIGEIRHRSDDAALPVRPRGAERFTVRETGLQKQVYDLKNAGPGHRFTVAGNTGILIVHNCTQAVARDCLAEAMQRVTAAGYKIVMHVHDEMIVDVLEEDKDAAERITELMSIAPEWAEGLPLKGETYETPFYKKD